RVVEPLHGVTAARRRSVARAGRHGEAQQRGKSHGVPCRRFRYDWLPHGLVLLFASILVAHALCPSGRWTLGCRGVKNSLKALPARAPETVPPQPARAEPERLKAGLRQSRKSLRSIPRPLLVAGCKRCLIEVGIKTRKIIR